MREPIHKKHSAWDDKTPRPFILPSGRICFLITGLCVLMYGSCIFIFYLAKAQLPLIISFVELLLCGGLIKSLLKKQYRRVIFSAYLGLGIHALCMTALTGWESGFYLQVLLVISMLFFCPFRRSREPFMIALFLGIAFLALRIIFYLYEPPYLLAPESLRRGLYLFNSVFSVFPLIGLSVQYSSHINHTRHKLFERNQSLLQLASVDPLTGLLNRRSMVSKLDKAMYMRESTGRKFALAICDIDDFKKTNDCYGHTCGDHVLKTLSGLIRAQMSEADAACRWGGEELLILFADNTHAQEICEKLRQTVCTYPFGYENNCLTISMTVGLCTGSTDLSVNEMLIQADQCLYSGKNSGKNCVVSS